MSLIPYGLAVVLGILMGCLIGIYENDSSDS